MRHRPQSDARKLRRVEMQWSLQVPRNERSLMMKSPTVRFMLLFFPLIEPFLTPSSPVVEHMPKIIQDAFTSMRESVFNMEIKSGCTVVSVIAMNNHLWVSNCGDARAVISRKGKAMYVNYSHLGSMHIKLTPSIKVVARLIIRPLIKTSGCGYKSLVDS